MRQRGTSSRSGRLFVIHDGAVGEDVARSSCTARKTLGMIGRARVSVVVYAHIMRVRANGGGGGSLLRSEPSGDAAHPMRIRANFPKRRQFS